MNTQKHEPEARQSLHITSDATEPLTLHHMFPRCPVKFKDIHHCPTTADEVRVADVPRPHSSAESLACKAHVLTSCVNHKCWKKQTHRTFYELCET